MYKGNSSRSNRRYGGGGGPGGMRGGGALSALGGLGGLEEMIPLTAVRTPLSGGESTTDEEGSPLHRPFTPSPLHRQGSNRDKKWRWHGNRWAHFCSHLNLFHNIAKCNWCCFIFFQAFSCSMECVGPFQKLRFQTRKLRFQTYCDHSKVPKPGWQVNHTWCLFSLVWEQKCMSVRLILLSCHVLWALALKFGN